MQRIQKVEVTWRRRFFDDGRIKSYGTSKGQANIKTTSLNREEVK